MISATRYHDFSAGHRVAGHENKCAMLHGHNYRVHFTCIAPSLDQVGRVIDFGVMKTTLCEWVETNWDHRMLLWRDDDVMLNVLDRAPTKVLKQSIVWVPFNPTAENMAYHLMQTIGPELLRESGITLSRVQIDETRKCSAIAELNPVALERAICDPVKVATDYALRWRTSSGV